MPKNFSHLFNNDQASVTRRFLGVSAVILLLNIVLYNSGFSGLMLQTALVGTWALAVLGRFSWSQLRKRQVVVWLAGIVMVMASINMYRWANDVTEAINLLTAFTVGMLSFYLLLKDQTLPRSLLETILVPVRMGLSYLGGGLTVLKNALSFNFSVDASKLGSEKSSLVRSIAVGLIVSVPVVAVLLSLFASADPIFADYIQNIFSQDLLQEIPGRLIFSIFFAALLAPVMAMVLPSKQTNPVGWLYGRSWVHEMTVVMVLVALVVGLFLTVQWPYVFVQVAKETDLSQHGVATYSEYVTRGFNELLQAAIFIFGLVWLGLISLRGKRPGQKTILPVVQMVVLAEFGLFLTSLARRVWLYQSLHGWTLTKIYGGFILLIVLGMTITLALRHFSKWRWVAVEVVGLVLIGLMLGNWNAEQFIIDSGHLPTVNERVDYTYLSRMSPDGYEGWLMAYNWASGVLNNPELDQAETLSDAQRREIAYAGRVIQRTMHNYHFSMNQRSTDEEYKQYYLNLIERKQRRLETEATTYQQVVQQRQESLIPTSDIERDLVVSLNGVASNSQKQIQALEEMKQALAASNAAEVEWEKFPSFSVRGDTFFDFERPMTKDECSRWFKDAGDVLKACPEVVSDFTLFYSDPQGKYVNLLPSAINGYGYPIGSSNFTRIDLNGVERLLISNRSEATAARKLRQEVSLDQLFADQARFFELRRRILQQPTDQRDYEHDLDLNSPFVGQTMW